MATLVIKSDGFLSPVIKLKLGTNLLGRDPDSDFQIDHPTVSAKHCEILLSNGDVTVRDCGSTNGTLLDGKPIREARLGAGQILSLGDVEISVETLWWRFPLSKFPVRHHPVVLLTDSSHACRRHSNARVTHQCAHCKEFLCDACVHRLRRRGGKLFKRCPVCSHVVEDMGGGRKTKRSLLGL
jgi:hypothetical protein